MTEAVLLVRRKLPLMQPGQQRPAGLRATEPAVRREPRARIPVAQLRFEVDVLRRFLVRRQLHRQAVGGPVEQQDRRNRHGRHADGEILRGDACAGTGRRIERPRSVRIIGRGVTGCRQPACTPVRNRQSQVAQVRRVAAGRRGGQVNDQARGIGCRCRAEHFAFARCDPQSDRHLRLVCRQGDEFHREQAERNLLAVNLESGERLSIAPAATRNFAPIGSSVCSPSASSNSSWVRRVAIRPCALRWSKACLPSTLRSVAQLVTGPR